MNSQARSKKIASVSAFALYQLAALALYGRPLLGRFASYYAGHSSDPAYYIWCMVWWLYAPAHGLNPFFTKLLWAPEGFNVAWSTCIPLLSLLAAPVTLWRGPIVAFNLLNVIVPAVTAWSGFLLIRRLVGQTGPALMGGYLFGFSPFMAAAQSAGHIVFTAAFLLPAAVYLFIARVEGRMGTVRFCSLLALVFVAQFLISIEVAATMAMFGIVALAIAAVLQPDQRPLLRSTAITAGNALLATGAIVSPYLFYMLRASGLGLHPIWSGVAAADLLEFVVPTRVIMIGGLPPLRAVAAHYLYDTYAWDSGAYASLPALIVALIFLRSHWRQPTSKLIAVMIAIVAIAMLGRHLRIAGHNVSKLPWLLIGALPFIDNAVTARFALYFHLLLAITVSLWMTEQRRSAFLRWTVAALIILLQLPNVDDAFWVHRVNVPAFFTEGAYRRKLREGEIVLALPYAKGDSMLWQIASGMYFALPEGWTGPTPRSFEAWPIVRVFLGGAEIPDEERQLKVFLEAHHVSAILIDPDFPRAEFWRARLQAGGAQIEQLDGVMLARFATSENQAKANPP